MTPRSPSEDDKDKSTFDAQWQQLLEEGQAPERTGRTAREEAERAATVARRKKPLQPTEQRRRGRKVTVVLPRDLVEQLRQVCQDFGYTNPKTGAGTIESDIVMLFLGSVLQLYRAGRLELTEETTTVPVRQLVFAGEVQASVPRPTPTARQAISPTLSPELAQELRQFGRELGHVDSEGNGVIAAEVIALLLQTGLELYSQGQLYASDAWAETAQKRLLWKARQRMRKG